MNKRTHCKVGVHPRCHKFTQAFEPLESRRLLSAGPSFLHAVTQYPESEGPAAATAVGDLAFFAGFLQSTAPLFTTAADIYNVRTRRWYTGSLSQARTDIAAASVGDKAIFAGGTTPDDGISSVVDILDTSTDQWSTAQLPEPGRMLAAASVGNYAIFAGGSVADIYDNATGQWSTENLSVDRLGICAATVGDLALFVGGAPPDPEYALSNAIDIFNAHTGQWTSAQLPQACSFQTAVTIGHYVLFTGQSVTASSGIGFESTNAIEVYNADTGQWSNSTFPNTPSVIAGTAVGDLALFAEGASDACGSFSNLVEMYDADTGKWSQTTLATGRQNESAVTAGGEAIFGGGDSLYGVDDTAVDTFTPVVSAPLISGAIGTASKSTATVTITDSGIAAQSAPYYVDIYASTRRTFDSTAKLVGSVRIRTPLARGQSVTLKVPITAPIGLAAGNYHLILTLTALGTATQLASTRQTFSLGTSAAQPSAVQPMLSAPMITTPLANPWLADTGNILEK